MSATSFKGIPIAFCGCYQQLRKPKKWQNVYVAQSFLNFSVEIISPVSLAGDEAAHHCRSTWGQEKSFHVGLGKEEREEKNKGE